MSTRGISSTYLSMVVCISRQTTLSQLFHLKHFSSVTCNLKVLSYQNISCVQMITYDFRISSSIFFCKSKIHFFGNGLVTSYFFAQSYINTFTTDIYIFNKRKNDKFKIHQTTIIRYKAFILPAKEFKKEQLQN